MAREQSTAERLPSMTKEEIQAMNEAFNALPKPEQRKRIAKEVLLMLEHGSMIAGYGYGTTRKGGKSVFFLTGDLQEAISSGIVCEGCAKAAIIAAKASISNDIQLTEHATFGLFAQDRSKRVFGTMLSDVIEAIFENDMGYAYDHILKHSSEWKAIVRFKNGLHDMFEYDEDGSEAPRYVMETIFQNIVDNGGYLVIDGHKFGTNE